MAAHYSKLCRYLAVMKSNTVPLYIPHAKVLAYIQERGEGEPGKKRQRNRNEREEQGSER